MPKPEQEQDEPSLCPSPFDDLSSGRLGSSFCKNLFQLNMIMFSLLEHIVSCPYAMSFTAALSSGVIASGSMNKGSAQVLPSAVQSPVGSFIESHLSSSVPNNLPSPLTMASIGKQFGLNESSHSMDEIMFSNQCIPSFHPHSLPEYHDSLANGVPYNSSTTIGSMAHSVGSKVTEGINSRHIQGVRSNGHLMEHNGGGKS